MIKYVFTTLFLFLLSCAKAQETVKFPYFQNNTLEDVLDNDDWEVLKRVDGDLNDDSQDDVALILQSKDSVYEKRCESCKLKSTKARILLVFVSKEDSQKLISQNNDFIIRGDEGGMAPYIEPEISIDEGVLKIDNQFTRSRIVYNAKFMDGEFVVSSVSSSGTTAATGAFENHEIDFEKGIIHETKGFIDEEEFEEKTLPLTASPKKLSEFSEMMNWEIAPYIFI
ncbi:MAG: hypothetical protein CL868_12235 [Cytophagaceae bacterium]|nr:hypothetical protein [Cytophagaceae bacterium]|tara:strand:+ start:1526 stop:2203 length:678 start_codon:yes stop_codon:yes gene_type:complete